MSLIQVFLDAFKKASTPKTPDAREHARNDGLLGPTNQGASGSFEPIQRTAPQPSGPGAADAGVADPPLTMSSGDTGPTGESPLKVEGIELPTALDLKVAADPEEGGETAIRLDRDGSGSGGGKVDEEPADPEEGGETAIRLNRDGTAQHQTDPEEEPEPGAETPVRLDRGTPDGGAEGTDSEAPDGDPFKVEIEHVATIPATAVDSLSTEPSPSPAPDGPAGDAGEAEPAGAASMGQHFAASGVLSRGRGPQASKFEADDDDEWSESATIVDLKVEPRGEAMQSGLSGETASELDADFDLDDPGDADDADF